MQDGDLDYRLIFESSPEILLVLRADPPRFTMVAATEARLRATNTTREQVAGRPLFEVFPDNPADGDATGTRNLRASLDRVIATGAPDTMAVQKYDIRRADGSFETRWWSPKNIPVKDPSGRVRFVIHRVEDVTALVLAGRTEAELRDRTTVLRNEVIARSAELGEANRELREVNARLDALNQKQARFFNDISHELRTPLTLVLGPLEELLIAASRDPAVGLYRSQLEIMRRSTRRMQRLINALLDFASLEAGRHVGVFAPTDLAQLTEGIASMFRSAAKKAGLRFAVDCPPLPSPVFVDAGMWEKIVTNLIANAVKFTLEGGIRVSLRDEERFAVLEVADSGSGIPKDELPHVFDRFHRAATTRSRSADSTGIGLALVKELVQLHGGTVDAVSEEGRGTTLTVRIPFGSAHLPQEQVRSSGAALEEREPPPIIAELDDWLPLEGEHVDDDAAHGASGSRARVLVVDDNRDMRTYLRRILSDRFDVRAAEDGAAALEVVSAWSPDVVVSDVMMPRIDGFRLVEKLRSDPRTRDLPVILLSAQSRVENATEGIERGANDYVAKPFAARELVARIQAQLKMRETREADRAIRLLDGFRREVRPVREAVLRLRRALVEENTGEIQDDLEDLLERMKYVDEWVENHLDWRRLIEGKLEFRTLPYSLRALVQEVVADVRRDSERVGVEIDVSEVPDASVRVDPERTARAFRVLLRTALSSASVGDVIDVQKDGVTGLRLRFPLPANQRKPLPLAVRLCGAVVEKQNGTWDCRFENGDAVFFAQLPVDTAAREGVATAPTQTAVSAQRTKEPNHKMRACRIMLVEDDPDIRFGLEETLTSDGFEVVGCVHGLDALKKLAQGAAPDVILTDLMMPVMNGEELRRALGEHPEWRKIPIVVLSGAARPDHKHTLEVEGVLSKPVNLERLLSVLSAACEKRFRALLAGEQPQTPI